MVCTKATTSINYASALSATKGSIQLISASTVMISAVLVRIPMAIVAVWNAQRSGTTTPGGTPLLGLVRLSCLVFSHIILSISLANVDLLFYDM